VEESLLRIEEEDYFSFGTINEFQTPDIEIGNLLGSVLR
jgi:hypothetical protein